MGPEGFDVLTEAAENLMPPRILGWDGTEREWFDRLAELRFSLEQVRDVGGEAGLAHVMAAGE